jgi:hypothetical protein
MNRDNFRLVFNRVRGMLVAVAETAASHGNSSHGSARSGESGPAVALRSFTLFSMRHVAFAALAVFGLTLGLVPVMVDAQIVPAGAHAPNVINTANGLPQVNVSKPSRAGVSLNTYSPFDVNQKGAILNNSPAITNTQLAGQISGNLNLAPGQAAIRGWQRVEGRRAMISADTPTRQSMKVACSKNATDAGMDGLFCCAKQPPARTHRRTFMRIMIGWGIASACMAFLKTPWLLYSVRFLPGAFEAGFFPGLVLYLTYWFPASRRAAVTSWLFVAVAVAVALTFAALPVFW